MTPTPLLGVDELISRLEKASGPVRSIDYDIADILKLQFGTYSNVPRFSESIDSALTLVPEEWTRSVDATVPDLGIDVDLYLKKSKAKVTGTHEHEAIATVIAALRARSQVKK